MSFSARLYVYGFSAISACSVVNNPDWARSKSDGRFSFRFAS